jgi:hypothetical protein
MSVAYGAIASAESRSGDISDRSPVVHMRLFSLRWPFLTHCSQRERVLFLGCFQLFLLGCLAAPSIALSPEAPTSYRHPSEAPANNSPVAPADSPCRWPRGSVEFHL